MSGSDIRILFLGKAADELCSRAATFLTTHASSTVVHLGRRGDVLPRIASEAECDYIVSYLSPWIVPLSWLGRAKIAAINFHPGSPEYPGIGCTNFALYEGATTYGVTCHHMASTVDTGPIISVRRFPVYPDETVLSLTQRSYASIADLFYEIADRILTRAPLPQSAEGWTRRPFRRAELEALCRLTEDMSEDEVRRRVRATTFPGYLGVTYGSVTQAIETPSG